MGPNSGGCMLECIRLTGSKLFRGEKMTKGLNRIWSALLIAVFSLIGLPVQGLAQGERARPFELRDAVRKASTEKEKNPSQVQSFFLDSRVKSALENGGISAERVQKAVSTLNADELAALSARTAKIQNDFAAGALSNQDLT